MRAYIKRLLQCRLCWSVAMMVSLTILLVELFILFFSYRDITVSELSHLQQTGLQLVRSTLEASRNRVSLTELSERLKNLQQQTLLKNIAIYQQEGHLLVASSDTAPSHLAKQSEPLLDKTQRHLTVLYEPSQLEQPYYIVAVLDAKHYLTNLSQQVWRLLVLMLVNVFLVTVLILVFLQRRLLTPIFQLQQNLLAVRDDPTHARRYTLRRTIRDELQQVFHVFNQLTQKVSESIQVLHDQNSKRKQNLQQLNQQLQEESERRTQAEELSRSMAEFAEINISKRKHYEEELYTAKTYDAATHFFTRTAFENRLQAILLEASALGLHVALICFRIHDIVDSDMAYGHQLTKQLLKLLAERIEPLCTEDMLLARLANDRFALAMNKISGTEFSLSIAQKLLDEMTKPCTVEGIDIHLAISQGIAFYPDDANKVEELINYAETAMDHAQLTGYNNIQFFIKEMQVDIKRKRLLLNDLQTAFKKQQLVLYYQPQFNLNSKKIVGVEALLRWQHPTLGYISPDEFIPIAEEAGLIIAISEWALLEACQANQRWQKQGWPRLRVAVNLSAMQFHQSDLLSIVEHTLEKTNLPPELLELEMTETVAMQEPASVAKTMQKIRNLGVQLAIDDFGTGYSSLAYLKQLPYHRIKIDKSFICDLEADASHLAIVDAMIHVAKSYQMEVLAEGIETAAQLKELQQRDCDEGQGFYFSHPLVEQDLANFITNLSEGTLVK